MPAAQESRLHLEIAHILFLDVVGYSKLLVNEQREIIQQLNEIVRATPQFHKSSEAGKLIRIPTGDGMALVFFQTPEEPVQCAMEVARNLKSYPNIRLRMGVHSGPVDQVTDVNDRTNVAGSGINFAQRVMSLGDAGHILLSRRVADDLAQDSLWQPLLHDLGEIEVKHGAKLGIINLYSSELGNPQPPQKFAAQTHASTGAFQTRDDVSELPEKSIAVLPFESLSADPNNTFFADAIQDEILTDLSKIADLKVISRTSVMQYKTGVKRNLREIADELGVAHIVEGSVQPVGNRVRVRAQLIDARSDNHLWAERYDRPLDDVFAIQTDIAKGIADQLQAKLSPTEKAAIEQPPTSNLVAYDRYLRAKRFYEMMTFDARSPETLIQAIRLLEQAVAHDPKFLVAHCLLARSHAYMYFLGADHTPSRVAQAKNALNTALQLQPYGPEPHLVAAWLAYHCHRDYQGALAELAIAQPGLPNDPSVFSLPAFIARRRAEWEQCTANFERAVELDPRSSWITQQAAQTYWLLRRFPDMARLLDRGLIATPGDANTRVARALVDLESHADVQPVHETIQAILVEDPSTVDAIADQWLYVALCRRNEAEITSALASIPELGIIPFNVRMPRSFCEGLVARAQGNLTAADNAFSTTRTEMEKALREQPDYAEALSVLAMSDAARGRKEDALNEGRRAAELLPVTKDAMTGAEILRNLAITYAWVGEKDLAIKQLEELLPLYGPISYGQLRLHPWWGPLRDDPRFERIMEEAKKPVGLK
jgi:TolB-like protein/Tfp pilus assembly protein PilF